MIERDQKDDFVAIRCDDCGIVAPSTADKFLNVGLNGMGWLCVGGTHLCEACKGDRIAPAFNRPILSGRHD